LIASFNSKPSAVFNTYGYGYTLKAGSKEDLTQFWDIADPECPAEKQDAAPPEKCELDKTNAILQNKLTNRYSDLHYIVDGIGVYPNYAIALQSYNLTEEGDQAALGLNVGEDEGKSIGELGNTKINGTIAFTYKHSGGAHTFRAAASDDDFWYKDVPATPATDTTEVTILVSELAGMGSFAGDDDAETAGTPFDLQKVSKFLWAVEYKAAGQNRGSLLIDDVNAIVEK